MALLFLLVHRVPPRPAGPAFAPVPDGDDYLHLLEAAQLLEPVVDHLPAARDLRVDFALACDRAAAGPVEQALRAPGDRADPGGQTEYAIAALAAFLHEDTRPLFAADEERVESRERRPGHDVRHLSHAVGAGHHQDRVRLGSALEELTAR